MKKIIAMLLLATMVILPIGVHADSIDTLKAVPYGNAINMTLDNAQIYENVLAYISTQYNDAEAKGDIPGMIQAAKTADMFRALYGKPPVNTELIKRLEQK